MAFVRLAGTPLDNARALGTCRPRRRRVRCRHGHRTLRLHPDPAADDHTGRPRSASRGSTGDRELRRIPRGRAGRHGLPAAGPIDHRVAGSAGPIDDHPGSNTAAAQHNWMVLLRTVAGFASAVVFVIAVNLMLDHRPPHLPGWGGHILGRVDQTEFVRLAGQRRLARRRVGRCPVGGTVGVVVRALDASDPARGSAAFAGVRNRTARPGSGAVAALIGAVLFGPPSSGSARSPWQPDACSDSPAPWRC